MIRAVLETPGLTRMAGKFSQRINFIGGSGMREVLKEAGEELVDEFKKEIRSFTPGRVQDLAESTKKQKAREGYPIYPILVKTQQFIDSIYIRVFSANAGSGWRLKLGFKGSQKGISNQRIAEIHINGEGNNPRRDFTRIPSQWKANLFTRIRSRLSTITK